MKQETFEQAAFESSVDYKPFEYDLEPQKYYQYGFEKGAKLQAEKMYSEEDLKEAFKVNYTPFSATNIGDFDKDWDKWFKQFKKK